MTLDMEDIESIVPPAPRHPPPSDSDVQLRNRPTTSLPASTTTFVPGSAKIHFKTYGCAHNASDSEFMAGVLNSQGYDPTAGKDDADCWVINSCTVKDPSEAGFLNYVKEGKKRGKAVVVAGCVPQADRGIKGLEGVSVIGVQQIGRVGEAVEQALQGNTIRMMSRAELPSLDLPKIRKNPLVEIIPLSTGCLGNCTYCKTKHARGNLMSYRPEEIVRRAVKAHEEGAMEIWLSSEDTGAYGLDIGTTLSNLLDSLCEKLPSTAMLRVGMTNPPYILSQLDSISNCLNRPNVFSFLHVPVQSGSDHVLTGPGGMNREYTRADFEAVADHLLEAVPGVTIATDIICGFPNETEEDFEKTMTLIEKYKFAICNISQFYPRPGTPAAKMKRIDTKIVKGRSRRFSQKFNGLWPYEDYVGKVEDVWIGVELDSTGTKAVGHTKNYTKVLVPMGDGELVGCKVRVKVEKAMRWHVEGEILGGSVERLVPIPTVPNAVTGDVTRGKEAATGSCSGDGACGDSGSCEGGSGSCGTSSCTKPGIPTSPKGARKVSFTPDVKTHDGKGPSFPSTLTFAYIACAIGVSLLCAAGFKKRSR